VLDELPDIQRVGVAEVLFEEEITAKVTVTVLAIEIIRMIPAEASKRVTS